MNLILAQSSLDGAMSEGLGIIAKFLYIIAVIVIAHGGWAYCSSSRTPSSRRAGCPQS
jgi:hypothetical protein